MEQNVGDKSETTIDTKSKQQKEYNSLLERTLKTNTLRKSNLLLEKVGALISLQDSKIPQPKSKSRSSVLSSTCHLTKANKLVLLCIFNLETVRDNLLSAFMAMTEPRKGKSYIDDIKRQLGSTAFSLMTLVSEADGLASKLSENAMALHIAVDWLRDPRRELEILDLSKSGRLPISHFSCNEAVTMCLSFLQSKAQKLKVEGVFNNGIGLGPGLKINITKIHTAWDNALEDLRDAGSAATKVFKVLLYCNDEGKRALGEYVNGLKPQELNDLISELQTLRRGFDEINIILERLGWSLADIWGRCSGKKLDYGILKREGVVANGKHFMGEGESSSPEIKGRGLPPIPKKSFLSSRSSIAMKRSSSKCMPVKDAKFVARMEKIFGSREKVGSSEREAEIADANRERIRSATLKKRSSGKLLKGKTASSPNI